MTPEIHRLAGDLFHRLRALPRQERESVLDVACGADPELRSEVIALLEADEQAGDSFLERPALAEAADLLINASELPLPAVIADRYRIAGWIGSGGMGVVYKAEDLRLSRPVALKLLSAPFARDQERCARFQREARAASQLNDPHITAIYDAGADHGLSYIAMEIVEGRTLRQMITDGPRPDADAVLNIVGQVASALTAAHKAGIVHRDIKPENIMVRPDGLVKVLDFGLARVWPSSTSQPLPTLLTRPGQVAGTIQYLSPEQATGGAPGPASDIFSLGVVAYEFATGERPFDGPTDGAIFDAILHRLPKRPSEVRPELEPALDALIVGALEKDPQSRIQTAQELKRMCGSAPIRRVSRARTPLRRRSLLAAAVSVAGLAIGGALWIGWPSPQPRVLRTFRITNNGPVHGFVNDGSHVYYSAGPISPRTPIYRTDASGGEPAPVPGLNGFVPMDMSAGGARLLLREIGDGGNAPQPLWVASVNGTGLRRLKSGLAARYARWSRRGDRIVYSGVQQLGVANAEGSDARVLFHEHDVDADVPHFVDGDRRVRFTAVGYNATRLFEVNLDGTGLHPLLDRWEGGLHAHSAIAPDGRYGVFSAGKDSHGWDLYALREGPARWFGFSEPEPVRLTSGPVKVERSQFSQDGRRVFFIGDSGHSELVRLDEKSGAWIPYLGGIDGWQLDFSRDGQWITFVGPPGGSVWRRPLDGSEAVQLTAPPLIATNPRWSPDGTKIVFYGGVTGQATGMFTVAASGGPAIPLLPKGPPARFEGEPSWSPDGKRILYDFQSSLEVIDLESRAVEQLPNSDGLFAARWSPDGKYAAAPDRKSHLILYDMASHERTVLSTAGAGYPGWSPDSRYVYFQNRPCTILYRVDIHTREVKTLANLESLRVAADSLGWVGVAPDGTVISARDVSTRNIYAVDVEFPKR